ncbi:MAG TPA: hypothetical protein VNO18_11235, partial [Xanthobacteraceae bacterium]|nr:hypothetical protein [Xanthobacteraceae bacterium]
LGCNSPSNAPLVEDCCSCVILAELSACILICGQAAWELVEGSSHPQVKDDFNGATKQNHQISGAVISHTTTRTPP